MNHWLTDCSGEDQCVMNHWLTDCSGEDGRPRCVLWTTDWLIAVEKTGGPGSVLWTTDWLIAVEKTGGPGSVLWTTDWLIAVEKTGGPGSVAQLLQTNVATRKSKNVEVLHLASDAAALRSVCVKGQTLKGCSACIIGCYSTKWGWRE